MKQRNRVRDLDVDNAETELTAEQLPSDFLALRKFCAMLFLGRDIPEWRADDLALDVANYALRRAKIVTPAGKAVQS